MHHQKDLIDRIASKDRAALNELYQLFKDKVYNTAISYVQSAPDAEEVTQDVFVNIYRNAGTFKGTSTVSTWIYRIAVNTSLNKVKQLKRRMTSTLDDAINEPHEFEHPGVLLERKEEAKYLYRAIDTLPENQKTAFILSFVEELPRQEVADIMETSYKSVESLLQRAKQNLRERLKKMYPNRRK